jgi:ABC-type polar amino acid transport system ATPase subunit
VEGADAVSPAIVRLENLCLSRGARQILTGVSIDVGRGRVVALMGASGSGKTTILRAIAGLERFDRGAIDVDGVRLAPGPTTAAAMRPLRSKVCMVFQFHCLFEHLPVIQNVWLAPVHVHRTAKADAERRARELLALLGVDHRAQALPRELSGGEAQRVAIARALASDPPVLLMDEPTASLDPERRVELGSLLKDLVRRGRTLIIATHDEDFVADVATDVLKMVKGQVVTA